MMCEIIDPYMCHGVSGSQWDLHEQSWTKFLQISEIIQEESIVYFLFFIALSKVWCRRDYDNILGYQMNEASNNVSSP